MPSGNFIAASYIVDIYCLGVKNTLYQFNLSDIEYEDLIRKVYSDGAVPIECDINICPQPDIRSYGNIE